MGNSRSQPCQPRKQMYLFYLIDRVWNRVRMRYKEKCSSENVEHDTEISSQCSGCKGCDYPHDCFIFDSESEMAPNAEEEMLAVKPWGIQQDKERLRPPTYNAEDYAMALRRWGRRPIASCHDPQGTLPSTTSSSSGYVSGSGEMTLRQFTSVSELLNKLRADLRLAFPSFVQEFASSPADGITLLLETLRGVQLVQNTPPSGQSGPRIGTRRAALDELGCVECLAACTERCADAPRLLSQAQPGLLALAVCLTSSLNRSRVLALQLLTKVCQTPDGHAAVSEAVSTLRLRYGEGGRFRFLAGALLAPRAAIALRVAGISFLNSFLKSSPRTQTRLYIQAEACEAGLEPRVLQEWLTEIDSRCEDSLTDLLRKEVQKWTQNCVDVDALQKRLARAEETCAILGNKVAVLQDQLMKLQIKKRNDFNLSEINDESLTNNQVEIQRLSSNGEDEGISSSERSSSPEDLSRQNREVESKTIDNDQETTIDDVIEELRIIVKDAEEEDRKGQENFYNTSRILSDHCPTKLLLNQEGQINKNSEIPVKLKSDYSPNLLDSKKISVNHRDSTEINSNNEIDRARLSNILSKTSNDRGSLKIVVTGVDAEEAIVPAILYPQPPRRTPPCLSTIITTTPDEFIDHPIIYHSQHDDEDAEEETLGDGSDSLLSASRLKYAANNQCNNREGPLYLSKNGVMSRDEFSIDYQTNKKERITLKNCDAGFKGVADLNQISPYLEACRQFESVGKTNERNRYKSEIEKKKLLRRSMSHDFLDIQNSSLHSRRSVSKVEGRIRKFESMNSFDNCSPQNLSRNNSHRKTYDDVNSRKIRRSESCHQVSHSSKKENSSHGGSDSGLHYVTDFDMEPIITRRLKSDMISETPNQLAKSLDRIDEGLDSLVDIVIGGSKDHWSQQNAQKSLKEKNFRNFRLDDKQQGMGNISTQQINPSKRCSTKVLDVKKGKKGAGNSRLKTDGHCTGFYNPSILKNDELYRVDRIERNHQNELNAYVKIPNFTTDINNSSIISSFHYGKSSNKFLINDSGIFLPSGKPHDAFGIGKNRFNAGKYSGNPLAADDIGIRRNSISSLATKHGKVTDILSGLY